MGGVERVVGVQLGLREAAQQRVHRSRAQTRRPAVRRGGGGDGQLHGRPLHSEWASSESRFAQIGIVIIMHTTYTQMRLYKCVLKDATSNFNVSFSDRKLLHDAKQQGESFYS